MWTARRYLTISGTAITELETLLAQANARVVELEGERDEMRAAIFGGANYDPSLRTGNFVEMAASLHAAQRGGLARAEAAEASALTARRDALEEAAKVAANYGGEMLEHTTGTGDAADNAYRTHAEAAFIMAERIRSLASAPEPVRDADRLTLGKPDSHSGWQPMETAPKDGITILTIHADDLFPVCGFEMNGEWLRQTEGPEDMTGPGKWGPLYRRPTHWMPLPEPPDLHTTAPVCCADRERRA